MVYHYFSASAIGLRSLLEFKMLILTVVFVLALSAAQGKDATRHNMDEPQKGKFLPYDICGINHSDKIGAAPWLARLAYSRKSGDLSYSCQGALISSRYVLTAAHCVYQISSIKLESVRLGEYNTDQDPDCEGCPKVQDVEVDKIIRHEQYEGRLNLQNDIALIRLKDHVTFNQMVTPVCIPHGDVSSKDYVGEKLMLTTWRNGSNVGSSYNLKTLESLFLPVVSLNTCSEAYKNVKRITLNDSQLCTASSREADACAGEGGSSLVSKEKVKDVERYFTTAIVSYGSSKCGSGMPGVNTKVSKFTDWIIAHMEE